MRTERTPLKGVLRPVALLVSGTALAQLMPIAVSPVLTRLYAPSDYGALAWAVAIVTVATLVAGGTYDQAVNLPATREEAFALAAGVGFAGIAVAAVLLLVSGMEWLWRGTSLARMWYVPLAVMTTALFNAAAAWSNREARFGVLARARVTLAVVGVMATIGLGFLGWGEAGLMLGNLAGLAFATAVFWHDSWGRDRVLWQSVCRRRVLCAFVEHQRFPRLLLPSSLLNTLTNQLPVWFLDRLFGSGVVGHYSLMNRVLGAPLSLIGSSAGEVFRQRAAAEYRETGRCEITFKGFARGLTLVGILPTLVLVFWGPPLFAFAFGEQWREAGRYAQILALVFAFRCVVSPLSYVLIIMQRQRLDLVLQALGLAGAFVAWAVGALTSSPEITLGVWGAGVAAVYVIYLISSFRLSRHPIASVVLPKTLC